MSLSKKGKKTQNVRTRYYQQYLSGFEHIAQSINKDGNNKTEIEQPLPAQVVKGKGAYKVSVTLVIEQVSNDSGEYTYRVLLNDDPDILITPYSIRSKKTTGSAAYAPKKNVRGGDSFSLVYGVYEDRNGSLSHTKQHPLQQVLPRIYSYILGILDTAIGCTLLISEEQKTPVHSGSSDEGTLAPESVRENKKKGRGKTLRSQVLPKAIPEEATVLVETNGEILGGRSSNDDDRFVELGSGTDNGGAIADTLSNGQTPDIGF